mmetsp:Transcript_13680/g.22549  ORF Transcript_13680/g.22549 Transcript_13680/m.22549 type:complete len:137 (+) Transcript_13680:496-906(+)
MFSPREGQQDRQQSDEYAQMLEEMAGVANNLDGSVDTDTGVVGDEDGSEHEQHAGVVIDDSPQTDSVFHRIEALRAYLEEHVGEGVFLEAYRCVRELKESDDDSLLSKKVSQVLGSKQEYWPLIHQLICCEESVFN